MTLKRRLFLIPGAKAGAPEWQIEVSSGRERAVIYADLAGRITPTPIPAERAAHRHSIISPAARSLTPPWR